MEDKVKKVIKSLSLIVVIVLIGVFSLPLNTYALDNQTSYVNINTTQNLEVGGWKLEVGFFQFHFFIIEYIILHNISYFLLISMYSFSLIYFKLTKSPYEL